MFGARNTGTLRLPWPVLAPAELVLPIALSLITVGDHRRLGQGGIGHQGAEVLMALELDQLVLIESVPVLIDIAGRSRPPVHQGAVHGAVADTEPDQDAGRCRELTVPDASKPTSVRSPTAPPEKVVGS